ncbi:hypothetical protein ACB092_05G263100 [Castanea dentata]
MKVCVCFLSSIGRIMGQCCGTISLALHSIMFFLLYGDNATEKPKHHSQDIEEHLKSHLENWLDFISTAPFEETKDSKDSISF